MNLEGLYTLVNNPLVSEKASRGESYGQYVFKVAPHITKQQVKNSVSEIFDVEVLAVRSLNVKGKAKRTRYGKGKQKNWKKVIVTLAEGQRIDYADVT